MFVTNDHPDREALTTRGNEKVTLLRETTEALTALGNYLMAAHHEFEKHPGLMQEVLGEALRHSLGQYERAAEAIRRLHKIALREDLSHNEPTGT